MLFIRRAVSSVKRFSTMPELNLRDHQILEDKLQNSENLILKIKDEVTQLLALVVDRKRKVLEEENRRLTVRVEQSLRELVRLQVANGVLQVSVPGDGPYAKEYSGSSSAIDTSETVVSTELTSNETNTSKAPKPKKPAAPESQEPVDVGRLDIRVGKVLHAQVHPDANSLYIEQIDVGEEISRTVVSGLVQHIPLGELDERMVVVLCNLKPQKMRGIVSEAMVLCASTPETVELLAPPPDAKAGDKIVVPGYTRNPDQPFMNPKKKIFEKVAEDLKVNDLKQASYRDTPWQVEGRDGFVTVQALSGCHIR